MIDRFKKLEERLDEIQRLIGQPEVVRDQQKFQSLTKELARITPLVETFRQYQKVTQELIEVETLLAGPDLDPEMVSLYQEERKRCVSEQERLQNRMEELILEGEDPYEGKNIIIEIRAGTGGEEAALFAADLARMYSRWASSQGLKAEPMSSNPTGIGGFKEVIFSVNGPKAYRTFRYESGTHRVQRVPVTEASGRIHTSAVTVAVLPEAEEVEVEINPKDLNIDVFRSSGPGGQGVNTTDSAVRMTHLPTGLVVSCQDERSQLKNKTKALRILRTRLFDRMRQEQQAKISKERREQVGSGDRSERIRTYNFPDNRVTDHRIGLTLHNLGDILEGHLEELFKALERADCQKRLVGERGICSV